MKSINAFSFVENAFFLASPPVLPTPSLPQRYLVFPRKAAFAPSSPTNYYEPDGYQTPLTLPRLSITAIINYPIKLFPIINLVESARTIDPVKENLGQAVHSVAGHV